MSTSPNRLAQETSPYLQQHADNPVDWQPWDAQALALARSTGKPILLSIGYSACHWCHVMAHESFEDPDTAALMNEHFINIKVDREERPDLDKIYQTSHALLTQRAGGWPLTLILTPEDQVAFFGGTYFPKEPRHGLPAFKELLLRIVDFLQQHRDEINEQNQSMVHALGTLYSGNTSNSALKPMLLDMARGELAQSFDAQWGGFGRAPKFPHVTGLERLLRHWAGTRDEEREDDQALRIAHFSLSKMAQGGVYDQLGGGFCRYSVDDYWMIPHFEKMLYDNGPLLALCAQTYAATGEPLFARTARETADWILREMQAPEGGYYSTLDADSEHEEGKFYVWDTQEVRECIGEQAYPVFAKRFGLDRPANFEGRWNLHVHHSIGELAQEFGQTEEAVQSLIDTARAQLFEAREQRIRPGRDEKILTSWNALAIRGMAIAARHLQEPRYVESADLALAFVRNTLWQDARLLATYKDGKAHLNAYLDDYAFLIDALLELLQVRWRSEDLAFAQALAEVLLQHFEDPQGGGFFFTADDHEALIQRPKSMADEAMPSGNGIAAQVLTRLGLLCGESRYITAAERAQDSAADSIEQAPSSHCTLLSAYEERLFPTQIIIIRANADALQDWHQICAQSYAPRRLSFAIPTDAPDLPAALQEKRPQGALCAYICEGPTCSTPLQDEQDLRAALKQGGAS